MRRLVIAGLLTALAIAGWQQRALSQSCPVAFCDYFGTTPYNKSITSLQRWCERWHHMHWDGAKDWMVAPRAGDETTADCGFPSGSPSVHNSCDASWPAGTEVACTCLASGSFCSSTNGGGLINNENSGAVYAITKGNYAGNTRTAKAHFGFRAHGDPGFAYHFPIYVAGHPNCHTGVQGIVEVQNRTTGSYKAYVQVQNDPLGGAMDFTECGPGPGPEFNLRLPSSGSAPTATLTTIGANDPPNYILEVNSSKDANGYINARARVYEVSNPTVAIMDTTNLNFSYAGTTWYNKPNKGQRFGVGSGPVHQPALSYEANILVFDTFRGDGC